jgi:hypothetical protein
VLGGERQQQIGGGEGARNITAATISWLQNQRAWVRVWAWPNWCPGLIAALTCRSAMSG